MLLRAVNCATPTDNSLCVFIPSVPVSLLNWLTSSLTSLLFTVKAPVSGFTSPALLLIPAIASVAFPCNIGKKFSCSATGVVVGTAGIDIFLSSINEAFTMFFSSVSVIAYTPSGIVQSMLHKS